MKGNDQVRGRSVRDLDLAVLVDELRQEACRRLRVPRLRTNERRDRKGGIHPLGGTPAPRRLERNPRVLERTRVFAAEDLEPGSHQTRRVNGRSAFRDHDVRELQPFVPAPDPKVVGGEL